MNVQQLQGKPAFVLKRVELEREFFSNGATSDMIRLLDRVQQSMEQAYEAGYQMAETISAVQWSNNAASGYAIQAAQRLGYTEEQITQLVRAINRQFDFTTIDEAKRAYCESPY